MDYDKIDGGQNLTSIQISGRENDIKDRVIDYINSMIMGNALEVSTRIGETKANDTIKDALYIFLIKVLV